ncbi:MAG: phage holin family protein [Gaiellaceae bacterium]
MSDTGLGAAAGRVAAHARRLVSLEVDLAKAEMRRKVGAVALGVGLGIGAALFGLVGLSLLVAAAVVALALVLPAWAAVLVVAGAALAVAGGLAAGAAASMRAPVPEQAIEEARLTREALRD